MSFEMSINSSLYCSKQEIEYFHHGRKFPHYLFILELEFRSSDLGYCTRSLGQKGDGRTVSGRRNSGVIWYLSRQKNTEDSLTGRFMNGPCNQGGEFTPKRELS